MIGEKRFRDSTQTMQLKAAGEDLSAAKTPKASVTVIRGGLDLGTYRLVEEPLVIGRAPDCGLCVHDLGISWRHLKIAPAQLNSFLLEDLGSTNGTRVNAHLVKEPVQLHDGDKIFLGETILRFSLGDEIDLGFQAEVSQLVTTDPLTGLESKRVFDEALDYALISARQAGQPLSLLMIDMDGIKQINDAHGHLFGAHAIGRAGTIIGAELHGAGRACRFGGDEFCVFLPGIDKIAAIEIADRVRQAVESADLSKDGIALNPTLSIGVATYPSDGTAPSDLVAAADAALYRAKAAGKNRVST